jgi:hypothetical protein
LGRSREREASPSTRSTSSSPPRRLASPAGRSSTWAAEDTTSAGASHDSGSRTGGAWHEPRPSELGRTTCLNSRASTPARTSAAADSALVIRKRRRRGSQPEQDREQKQRDPPHRECLLSPLPRKNWSWRQCDRRHNQVQEPGRVIREPTSETGTDSGLNGIRPPCERYPPSASAAGCRRLAAGGRGRKPSASGQPGRPPMINQGRRWFNGPGGPSASSADRIATAGALRNAEQRSRLACRGLGLMRAASSSARRCRTALSARSGSPAGTGQARRRVTAPSIWLLGPHAESRTHILLQQGVTFLAAFLAA